MSHPAYQSLSGTGTSFSLQNTSRKSWVFTSLNIVFGSSYSNTLVVSITDGSTTYKLYNPGTNESGIDEKNFGPDSEIGGTVFPAGWTLTITLGASATINAYLSLQV